MRVIELDPANHNARAELAGTRLTVDDGLVSAEGACGAWYNHLGASA